MQRALIFLTCIAFASLLSAQQIHFQGEPERPKRGYIGISLGAAIPMSEFASTDFEEDYSGYAKTGLSLQLINFGYTFGKNIGIAGMWTGNAFKVDGEEMLQDLGLNNFSIETEAWSFGALMVGLLMSLPANKFNFDIRAMLGYGYASAPEISMTGYVDGSLVNITQKSATANELAYDFGMGFRIPVSGLICLNVLVDYVGFKPTFSTMVYSAAAGIYDSFEFEQPMNHLTITGGIGFRLK